MRTEIQTHNLMLYDVQQPFCAPGPHHKCHAPARQRNTLGQNIQALGAPGWAPRPFFACEPRTFEYECWLYLDLPGRYASLIGREIKKLLAARPAGLTGETSRA
jgi:hypothetical protein